MHIIASCIIVALGYLLLAIRRQLEPRYLKVFLIACDNAPSIPFLPYRTVTVWLIRNWRRNCRNVSDTPNWLNRLSRSLRDRLLESCRSHSPISLSINHRTNIHPWELGLFYLHAGSIVLTIHLRMKLGASREYRQRPLTHRKSEPCLVATLMCPRSYMG